MGVVYLIKCNEYYKIGIATDVRERIAQLQTGNPYRLMCDVAYEYDNPAIVEKALHQRFVDSRFGGEWYALDNDGVHLFNQICVLLGGVVVNDTSPTAEDIEKADKEDDPPIIDKAEFNRMVDDGFDYGDIVGNVTQEVTWSYNGSKNAKYVKARWRSRNSDGSITNRARYLGRIEDNTFIPAKQSNE